MSAADVLMHAAARIGYYAPDDPEPGSEAGRYCAEKMHEPWLRGPSVSIYWCMCFVSMCFDLAGDIDAIGGFSYNTDTTRSRMAGRRMPSADYAQPGDVLLMDFDGDGRTDHVGIVEYGLGGGWVQTIEGNTSPGIAGSQIAGNGVYRRRRYVDSDMYLLRPNWSGNSAAQDSGHIVEDGWWGYNTTAALQRHFGTPVDGNVSSQDIENQDHYPACTNWGWTSDPDGSLLIEAMQKWLGVSADGIAGPATATALQNKLGVTADSYVGQNTVAALQRRINEGSL